MNGPLSLMSMYKFPNIWTELADSVDSDQIALDLLNVNNTLTQKRKVNVQVFPSKGKPKNNTIQVSFAGKNACFFLCTRLIQDTCTLHQRKYRYVV